MKLKSSILILLISILLISCTNPIIKTSIDFYKQYRNSWQSQGYYFLEFFIQNNLDEGQIANIKAKRNQITAELGESISSEKIEITETKILDKWVFEGQTYYKDTVQIRAKLLYDEDHTYRELIYIVTDEDDKQWITHSQIRKDDGK